METQLSKPEESEEFQNFVRLAKGLLAVPKSELDEKIREDNKKSRVRTSTKRQPKK